MESSKDKEVTTENIKDSLGKAVSKSFPWLEAGSLEEDRLKKEVNYWNEMLLDSKKMLMESKKKEEEDAKPIKASSGEKQGSDDDKKMA